MRKISLLALVLFAGIVPRIAHAYPQWQFSSGTSRCNQCHFAPAGGGLITNYARDAVGEDLSTFQGNGGFLHGAVELPSWLALGADLRGAFLRQDNGSPEGAMSALFPMQADAYARAAFADTFSLYVAVGYRGSARNSSSDVGNGYLPATGDRFISREHYLMWRSGALGAYVRAGRFYAPYGLRLAEHTTYVRRDVAFNLLDETYGLSAGYVQNEWEVHATAFIPDVLRSFGLQEKGVAAMFERRFADAYAVGVDGRVGISDDAKRFGGGLFGKAYVSPIKTLLMGQVDLFSLAPASGSSSNEVVGYFGPTVFPLRGVWLSAYFEHKQTDLRLKTSATEAWNGQINWFFYPHFELIIQGRMQMAQQQESAKYILAQLHYFL